MNIPIVGDIIVNTSFEDGPIVTVLAISELKTKSVNYKIIQYHTLSSFYNFNNQMYVVTSDIPVKTFEDIIMRII